MDNYWKSQIGSESAPAITLEMMQEYMEKLKNESPKFYIDIISIEEFKRRFPDCDKENIWKH